MLTTEADVWNDGYEKGVADGKKARTEEILKALGLAIDYEDKSVYFSEDL